HVGSSGFEGIGKRRLLDYVDWIKRNPNTYWIGMGDMIEAINPNDKRWDERQIADYFKDRYSNTGDEQRKVLSKMLRPIKNKCLGLLQGNHEETLRLRYFNDQHSILCSELDTPNLGAICLLTLHFFRNKSDGSRLTFFISHGKVGGRLIGATVNALSRLSQDFDADIYMLGHSHRKFTGEESRIATKNLNNPNLRYSQQSRQGKHLYALPTEVQYRKKLVVATGSFMAGYPDSTLEKQVSTYVEKGLFSPSAIGVPVIDITPFKYKRSVSGERTEIDFHCRI
ncbi:MAG: hypothetical protein QME51_10480, partial [Planctomycetota bacterium]|nr:hypothetical protein [Planctomycetota bacterium]